MNRIFSSSVSSLLESFHQRLWLFMIRSRSVLGMPHSDADVPAVTAVVPGGSMSSSKGVRGVTDALPDEATRELDLADLVEVIEASGEELQLQLSPTATPKSHDDTNHQERIEKALEPDDTNLVVALFCDGFVCRHWTCKNGWVEGFAQSYDATSKYFLECLENGKLPDGLLELMDHGGASRELGVEIWDLRAHPAALCPLTSADLPRTAPTDVDGTVVEVHRGVLTSNREARIVIRENPGDHDLANDQFPQLSNSELEALTSDELASLALGPDEDLLEVDDMNLRVLIDAREEDESENELLLDTSDIQMPQAIPMKPEPLKQLSIDTTSQDRIDEAELITPKHAEDNDLAPWRVSSSNSSSSSSSPTAYLSPCESKAMLPQSQKVPPGDLEGVEGADTTEKREWIVKSPMLSTLTSVPAAEHTIKLALSRSNFDWLGTCESPRHKKCKPTKHKKKIPSSVTGVGVTPLPATQLFLSKLKGKRPRNYTIDDLSHASPAWMMMKHMNRFYQAALVFERRHANFLQINVERIMKADHSTVEPTKLASGSMNYITMQLQQLSRPDQVIAAVAKSTNARTEATVSPNRFPPTPTGDSRDTKYSGKRSPTLTLPPFQAVTAGLTPTRARAKRSPHLLPPLTPSHHYRQHASPPSSMSFSPLCDVAGQKTFSFMDALDGGETFEF